MVADDETKATKPGTPSNPDASQPGATQSTTESGSVNDPAAARSADREAEAAPGTRVFLFYRNLERIDPARHGDLGLVTTPSYDFARETNSIPLNVIEFRPAARHYPIIFNRDPEDPPLVIVGVRSRENLFVEKDGSWAEGCYMPAFVRRYPFMFLTSRDSGEVAFCLDSDSPLIVRDGKRPLFSRGKPTDLLQNAARFCAAYAREQGNSRAFVAALHEQNLLIERAADITLPDGEKVGVRGFKVVDTSRLRELPADLVAQWWEKGWLDWISCHLVSLGNFGRIYFRAKQRLHG